MLVDYLICNEEVFCEVVGYVVCFVVVGYLVIFGVVLDVVEIGFGYIELGDWLDEQGVVKVCCFVEKFDEEIVCCYVESGGFLWNFGMFCFMVLILVDELVQYVLVLLEQVRVCLVVSVVVKMVDGIQYELVGEVFVVLLDIFIDYVLMECFV